MSDINIRKEDMVKETLSSKLPTNANGFKNIFTITKILSGIFTFIVLHYWKFENEIKNVCFLGCLTIAFFLTLPHIEKEFKPFLKDIFQGIIASISLNILIKLGSIVITLQESKMYWTVLFCALFLVVLVPYFRKYWNELGFLVYALSLVRLFYWVIKLIFNFH